MKVGIITIHHISNFGAVLQAYALSSFLRKNGFDAEIIDYRPDIAVRHYKPRLRLGRNNGLSALMQWYGMQRFIHRYLPLSKTCYRSHSDFTAQPLPYDVYIAGSDQIWCTTPPGSFRGYDPVFFLDLPCMKDAFRISYAASAGETTDFGSDSERVRNAVAGFNEIMVRDENTAKLIRNLAENNPSLVLDPVFLDDFSGILRKITPRTLLPKCLVIYGKLPTTLRRAVIDSAKKRNLTVYDIQKNSFIMPGKFLRIIREASIVITSNFHGAALSTKFRVPFLVYALESKYAKITNFLRQLDLESQLLSDGLSVDRQIDAVIGSRVEYEEKVTSLARHSEERLLESLRRASELPKNATLRT